MITAERSMIRTISESRLVLGFYLLMALMVVAVSAVNFQAPHLIGNDKILTDFDAFHIAGTLAGRGEIAKAYDAGEMIEAQARISGNTSFMPFTYPPPFTLLVDGLADLPIGFAFALFVLATFAFYVVVLHRIAGEWMFAVLILMMPTVMLNLRTGQNGFLIAGLIGAFLLAWRDRKAVAGLPLGLLVIKPHLAIGVGLLALCQWRWNVVAVAAAVVAALLSLSTLVYGFDVWSGFIGAVKDASMFLALGYYPMFRMGSVYAALLSVGAPASIAMAGHLVGTLIAVAMLILVARAHFEFRYRAAAICALSLFVSPYSYDYDFAILGIGFAFIARDLAERASQRNLAKLLLLAWAAGAYGLLIHAALPDSPETTEIDDFMGFALACPLVIALCISVFRLIRSPLAAAIDSRLPVSAGNR